MNRQTLYLVLLVAVMVGGMSVPFAIAAEDLFDRAPWSGSAGIGGILYEGDEEVENGFLLIGKLGYDFNPRWTLEGDFSLAPILKNRTFKEGSSRTDLTDDTWAVRLGADILFHLRNVENMHWDPFFSAGCGVIHYGDKLQENKSQNDLMATAGGGLFYHFNDAWALRVDARWIVAGADTEVNELIGASVNWRWGAEVPARYAVVGGTLDSDGDGLPDTAEVDIGTDPFDPDTDKDGLSDGGEVNLHETDPLNPDTDMDALKDGAEVLTYGTNPLARDTDNGGVDDGHEVIEDLTDPLDPADDLELHSLNLEFDYDQSEIRPVYFDELDVIVKVLGREAGATATVEGHADKRPESSPEYNVDLSERRAQAVVDYLVDVGGIARTRLTAKGYGFERPLVPNDSEENMQINRRTDIYIRPGEESSLEVMPVQ